jgi:ssDNA-binding replication factor A large subunit
MQREYEKHGFFSFSKGRNRELCCVKHGESEISTMCRILDVSRREIRTKEGNKKIVLLGIVADDTAKLPFVSWTEREELVKDTVVQIENASVKRRRGLPTLYIGRNTEVRVVGDDMDFPRYAELMKPKKRTIGEIVRCEGAFDVIVEGNIVSIVEKPDGSTLVLDDGTGAIFLELRDEEKEERIYFGMPVKARGNVMYSEKGYVLIVGKVKISGEALIINEMQNFLCRYT